MPTIGGSTNVYVGCSNPNDIAEKKNYNTITIINNKNFSSYTKFKAPWIDKLNNDNYSLDNSNS